MTGAATPHPWHALFAPLPDDAVPVRKPVAPPEVLATPEGAAVAGWEQVTVELSAGAAGLRVVMVVLDAAGEPVSASDMVMHRRERTDADGAPLVEFLHENVGGRLEPDGRFLGTRWRSVSVERADAEEAVIESVPSPPSEADAAALKALVDEVLRRL